MDRKAQGKSFLRCYRSTGGCIQGMERLSGPSQHGLQKFELLRGVDGAVLYVVPDLNFDPVLPRP